MAAEGDEATPRQQVHKAEEDEDEEIKEWQYKELLKDIEKVGGRDNTSRFLAVWNDSKRIYGEPASAKRRNFQLHLDLVKRRKPQSYLDLLFEKGIQPCPATYLAAHEQPKRSKKSPSKTSSKWLFFVVASVVATVVASTKHGSHTCHSSFYL